MEKIYRYALNWNLIRLFIFLILWTHYASWWNILFEIRKRILFGDIFFTQWLLFDLDFIVGISLNEVSNSVDKCVNVLWIFLTNNFKKVVHNLDPVFVNKVIDIQELNLPVLSLNINLSTSRSLHERSRLNVRFWVFVHLWARQFSHKFVVQLLKL